MFLNLVPRKLIIPGFAMFCLLSQSTVQAAMNPAFELDQKSLKELITSTKPLAKSGKMKGRGVLTGLRGAKQASGTVYTVRQGDNLFRILMREYSLSNAEAEALIEAIRHKNNIYDIKRLKVGQKIIIPPVSRGTDGTLKGIKSPAPDRTLEAVHGLKIESSPAALLEQDTVVQVKAAWDKLVPLNGQVHKPLRFEAPNFSLALDPQRFPVFTAQDGARIIVDQDASLSPLVRSLITAKDPAVRIVSEPSSNRKRFLAAMLEAGGFYSVEPDFKLEFGSDPKLRVDSDFKVEKMPDSLIKQDIVLLNSSMSPLPAPLGTFLQQEGFSVLEPFALQKPVMTRSPMRPLLQVASTGPHQIVDALLDALSVPFQTRRYLEVFPADKSGISLSVKVDRFFERSGKKYVVTSFDGDPVTYTLFRILETTGYRVVILNGDEDFRKISEKMLNTLQINSEYSAHNMWPDAGARYTMTLSGFRLEGPEVPDGSLFLTDRPLDPIIRLLLKEHGYEAMTK